MLAHEDTMILLKKAKLGDENAKEILISENAPLLKSVIRRFINKGIEYDDLYQLACVGFMKAVNNFDESFNVRFSTYVVPMVAGEVKRFLRDDGYIKVSRAIKVMSYKINRFIDDYRKKRSKEPTVKEIAAEFDVSEEDVVYALGAAKSPVSIFDSGDSEEDSPLIDRLKSNSNEKEIDDKLILKGGINKLNDREKKIIMLRYYRDMTQGQIAEYFGLSQVQISRIEAKILEKLKKEF